MIRITIQQLRIFAEVAKHQHVSQASSYLFLSQSAVSMGLAELEQQIGKPLFDRIGKKLLLNSNGKCLLPEAVDILHRVTALPQLLSGDHELSGELLVGASSTIGNYLLPGKVSEFALHHPHAKISLQIGNSETIIQQLVELNLDIGFIEGHCQHPDLVATPWQQDELVIIASPEHPMAKRPSLLWKDFAMTKWILREKGSGTREIFEQAIFNKLTPDVLLELGHSEAIKQAVMTGVGLSCISRHVIAQELLQKQLVILPTPERPMLRQLWQITHKQRYHAPVLKAFQTFLV